MVSVEAATTPSSKKKHWEYPWTVDEMRKAAGQWNLASDVGMLQHLQEFSQKLLSQTHEIQEQVDSLNHDAKLTNVRLHNVFNDFVMLANTQFVENRVYDEEVVGLEQTDGNKKLEEKEKTQEQKEMELIPKIKQAISLGLNVFDTAYEKLDMNIANSESEDEDAPNRSNVYLEPKDPYLHRPLPCLIGSDQFFQLDNLGLGNLLVEDERDDLESDHMSDGEAGALPVPKPPPLPERKLETDSDESDDDLFGVSKAKVVAQNDLNDEEEDEGEEKAVKDDKPNAAKSPLTDLHSELSRKLGVDPSPSAGPPPKRQVSVDKEGAPSARPRASKSKTQQMEGDGDLFGDALDEPTDDIFSRPSRLFTSRPTLFDDDEDESGGIFGSQKTQPKQEKPLPASAANKPVLTNKESEGRTPNTPQSRIDEISDERPSNKGKGLFDAGGDDDDDDEDLFATKPTAAAKQSKETKKPAVSLFDDDEDEDDSDIFSGKNKDSVPTSSKPVETENKPKLPAGAVSIFGGGDNLFKAAIQKANKAADDTDDVAGRSTISDKSLSKPSTVAKSLKPTPGSSTPSSTMSSSSLFAEDPELFTTMNKSKSSTADLTKESSQTKAKTGFSLFADEEDDDLFASLSKPASSSGNKTAGKEADAKKKTKSFLFEDNDDDEGDSGDLFALPKSSATKDEKKNITLVDEAPPQKASVETKPAAAKEPIKEPSKPNKVSLFSGSDDEDDLFALKKSPAKTKATTDNPPAQGGIVRASGKRQSLFDDDNFLFNTKDDDGPSIDLFKPSSAAKTENKLPQNVVTSSAAPSASSETKSTPIQKPTPLAAPRGAGTKLFGSLDDDDEDDLFSTLTTKSSEKKLKVSSKPAADETQSVKAATESLSIGVKGKPKNSLEDIFGDRPTQKEKAVAGVKEANASVVKLFDDPLGSETVAIKADRKTPDVAHVPVSPLLQPKGLSDDLFGDDKELNEGDPKNMQSLPPKSSTSPKVLPKAPAKGDRISKLQASIIIDPASHLPQKIKKIEQEKAESISVDFSLPSQTPILHSLAKDRVKIPTKRRPPTRKHAELHDSESHNGFGNETDKKEFVLGHNSTANVQPKLTLPAEKEVIDKNAGGQMGSEKITLAASDKEPFSLDSKRPPLLIAGKDNEEDDLFGTKSSHKSDLSHKSKQIATGAGTAPISATNDSNRVTGATSELKQTSANTDPVKSGVEARDRKEMGTSSKVNISDDDDIFAKRSSKTASAGQSTVDTKHDKITAAVDDDEDDLFGGKQLLSSTTQSATSKTKTQKAKVLSADKPPASTPSSARNDADDDDLFGTKTLIKPTAPAVTERAKNEERLAKKHLLSSDDDDIFNVPKNASASTAAKTKAAALTVKAAQADDDDDDIFANSSLAPKGARKAAGNKPKVKEPVFDDDDDDIFASVPSGKVKKAVVPSQPKKEIATDEDDLFAASSSSRPAHKKLVTKDEDLFHDDTDIFANIPSARPKDKKSQGKSVLPTATPLFTSEPDDIFAEAAASAKPAKVTSDTQKLLSKAKPKEDYDDIFDDPLNVLQK